MFEGVEPAELREETEEVGVMDVGEVGPIGPMDAKEEKGMDVKGEKVEKGAKHGTRDKGVERFVLGESLRLEYRPPRKGSGTGSLMMEWEGSPMNDLLADAVVATVMMVEVREAPWWRR